jgi:pimeloyl-ACP methyl ester carboxylesterase
MVKARMLPEPPFLIGHSMGGLVVQMLLDRGFGAAGVAISSAPPRGVPPIYYWNECSGCLLKNFNMPRCIP